MNTRSGRGHSAPWDKRLYRCTAFTQRLASSGLSAQASEHFSLHAGMLGHMTSRLKTRTQHEGFHLLGYAGGPKKGGQLRTSRASALSSSRPARERACVRTRWWCTRPHASSALTPTRSGPDQATTHQPCESSTGRLGKPEGMLPCKL